MLLMGLLSAPVMWPMATYSPKYSPAIAVWLTLITAGVLVIDAVLLASEKSIVWTGKVWRGLFIFPYAVFSSSCAILLAQVTLMYLSDPAESLWLKIIIGLVNLVYTIGCLLISIGITVGLAPDEIK
jgi:hypothetical protein